MKHFILMADIIESSKKEPAELLLTFKKAVSQVNKGFKAGIVSPLTITLGDEFQGVVKDLHQGLSILFFMEEAKLKSNYPFQLRYVLHHGEISTTINKQNAHEMIGGGLTRARKQLEAMKKSDSRFKILLDDDKAELKLNQSFQLYQYFVDGWKPKDLEEVSLFLEGKDYKEVAHVLKKDETSTWRRRRSLAINEYETCKSLIHSLV